MARTTNTNTGRSRTLTCTRFVVLIAAILSAAVLGLTACSHPGPDAPAPSPSTTAAGSSPASDDPPPPAVTDTSKVRAYLTGDGNRLVTQLQPAAQQLKDRPDDTALCKEIASRLDDKLDARRAYALASAVPDQPTADLFYGEVSAVGRTLTICLDPGKANAKQAEAAKSDLVRYTSAVAARLDKAGVHP